jgi:hypothetical protein
MRSKMVVGKLEILFRHLPEGTERNHENSQKSRYPDRDSTQALLECKSEMLLPEPICLVIISGGHTPIHF